MKQKHIFSFLLSFLSLFLCHLALACEDMECMEKCEPYREMVEQILESESVSTEFYYLMVAESRCTERAESDKGAKGFWQLMPSTSKHYGCDNPHDLECATRAAARYIRHLQKRFTRFDEVIMAYNMGGHNYKRCGATNEAKGLAWLVNKLRRHSGSPKSDEITTNDNVYSIFITLPQDWDHYNTFPMNWDYDNTFTLDLNNNLDTRLEYINYLDIVDGLSM